MRFKNLDLNLLVALDHMLKLRSVSAAASQMNMSQSAMSNALTRLRQYFDDQLLVQVGRQMEITPKAEAMREAVRDILVRIDATITTDPVFQPQNSTREFRILLSDYSLATFFPYLLSLVNPYASTIKFHLLPQMEKPYLVLERGEADFLIAPSVFCSRDHPSEVLYKDGFSCVVWDGGIHADKKMTMERYTGAEHVLMQPPVNMGSFESDFLESRGVTRKVGVISYSFAALPRLVIGTDRIATVHNLLARQAAQHLPIKILDMPLEVKQISQTVQWHGYKSQDPGIIWLRDMFRKAAQAMNEGQVIGSSNQ